MRAKNLLRAGCLFAAMSCLQAQADSIRDLGRETLHSEDNWAASGSGVIGSATALPEQIYVVGYDAGRMPTLNHPLLPARTAPLIS